MQATNESRRIGMETQVPAVDDTMEPDQREHLDALEEVLTKFQPGQLDDCVYQCMYGCGCMFVVTIDGDITWVDRYVSAAEIRHDCECHELGHHGAEG